MSARAASYPLSRSSSTSAWSASVAMPSPHAPSSPIGTSVWGASPGGYSPISLIPSTSNRTSSGSPATNSGSVPANAMKWSLWAWLAKAASSS